MQSNVDWSEFFGRAKTNYFIAKHVYTRQFVRDRSFPARSFESGARVACLVRKRDDLLLLNTWGVQLLFCSRTGLRIALALGCQPWELIIIASRTEFVRQFVYDKP